MASPRISAPMRSSAASVSAAMETSSPKIPIRSAFARGCWIGRPRQRARLLRRARASARERARLPSPQHPRQIAERAHLPSVPRVPARRRHPRRGVTGAGGGATRPAPQPGVPRLLAERRQRRTFQRAIRPVWRWSQPTGAAWSRRRRRFPMQYLEVEGISDCRCATAAPTPTATAAASRTRRCAQS